ncbi:MAG: MATE family efflux transporter [Lachnospiraceae bacterium]
MNQQAETNPMGTQKVYPLLITMSLPPMISMLIQSLYNVVDSIFVAKLGENALTAVSLAFPMQNLVLALAVGLGVGMNASIARNLGAGKPADANLSASHGILLAGIHSLFFVILGLFFTGPFIRMFTKDPQVIQWGTEYCQIVICLAFGSIFHIAIEKIFQAVGNMVVPMVLQAVGAVINIVLDPIFIFGYFGIPALGVKGAAIATIIGQMSACFLAVVWLKKRCLPVKVDWKHFHFSMGKVKELYMIAIPSAIVTAVPSTLVGILNGLLMQFSQTAVAVFGVYFKLQSFVNMPASGLIQGMRPIISYNYGAGNKDRIKEVMKASLNIVGGIMVIGMILFIGFGRPIMEVFSQDEAMISMGVSALKIISESFVFSTFAIVLSGTFEAFGQGIYSLLITFLRQLVFVPAFAFGLSAGIGLEGIWLAFPAAELLGAGCTFFIGKKALFERFLSKESKK